MNHAQKTAGHKGVSLRDEPLHSVWRGIRRAKGTTPGQKAPLLVADLRAAAEAMPSNLRGQRDRALLLLGFAGAFRRSELVALDMADLEFSIEGAVARANRMALELAEIKTLSPLSRRGAAPVAPPSIFPSDANTGPLCLCAVGV